MIKEAILGKSSQENQILIDSNTVVAVDFLTLSFPRSGACYLIWVSSRSA
jgi:hypothetical protein